MCWHVHDILKQFHIGIRRTSGDVIFRFCLENISYHIKLYFNIIHQKQISIKTQHDIKDMIKMPESIVPLAKVSTNIHTKTCKKYTLQKSKKYTRIHRTSPKMKPICIQIVKLISADFGSVWWFCNDLQQRITKRRPTVSNCTTRKHFLCFIDT